MSGRYLTDMADVLRAAGQTVVELAGWQSRARSSGGYQAPGPWCVMVHHTASVGNGANDANYCTFTDTDRPVCNLVLGRDATWYVCAAGATNTNGKGGPWTLADGRVVAADQMNLRAVGIEMSNNGVGMAYPEVMIDALLAGIVALAGAYLGGRTDLVCQHVNWAPTRKIDPATAAAVQGRWRPASTNGSGSWRLDDLVAELARRASSGPQPSPGPDPDPAPDPVEDDDVKLYLVMDPRDGAWFVSDMATFRTYVDSPDAAAEGVRLFGWIGYDGTEGPYPIGAQWTGFLDTLPRTCP